MDFSEVKAWFSLVWLAGGILWAGWVAFRVWRTGRAPSGPGVLAWGLFYLALGFAAALLQFYEKPGSALAEVLLRGASMAGQALFSAWALAGLVVLALLWPVLPALRSLIVRRLQTVTVGPVTLELGPAEESVSLRLAEESGAGGLEEMEPYGELAGTGGPVREKPPVSNEAYVRCLDALPRLFAGLNNSETSQAELAGQLQELEQAWPGEHAEELELSAQWLGFYARKNQVVLKGYLAKTLIFRHLMLLYFGRAKAAAGLVADLALVDPAERRRFLGHESSIRVLVALVSQRNWDAVQTLIQYAAAVPDAAGERAALGGYALLMQGRPAEALAAAATAGRGRAEVAQGTATPHQALLLVVQAAASLQAGLPLDAVGPARAALGVTLKRDRGVGQGLRTAACRTLARAALALGLSDRLADLYAAQPEAQSDPDCLNTLAVHAASRREYRQARALLRRAESLTAAGEVAAPLRAVISENLRTLDEAEGEGVGA